MKTIIPFLIILLLFTTGTTLLSKEVNKNNIQLAILLDTSNSMDGLIDQAKTQLWKIVNELARSQKGGEEINLHVALYEYGNDELTSENGYIRKVTSLTNDLDLISDELFRLKTNGGSEYCGTVIKAAVNDLKWNKNNDDLKIIVIAGNEPFTQGNIDFRNSCKEAISKGIIVNTIFCGDYSDGINTSWKEGADLADGKYMNIDQNQAIVHIDAPQDNELVKLGQQLNETYIAYGSQGKKYKERQEAQDSYSMELSPSVMAQRATAKASGQYKNTQWDLVDAEEEGVINLDEIEKDQLPDNLKNMNEEELKNYVAEMKGKREQLQKRINELNEARRKYVAEKQLDNQDNTFDSELIKALKDQAKKKNFEFQK